MKLIFALLKVMKSIFNTKFMQILANKKIRSKNQKFTALLSIENNTIIIAKILRLELSVFGYQS